MDGKDFFRFFCCDRKAAVDYLLVQNVDTQKKLVNWTTTDNQTIIHQIARDGDTSYLSLILNLANENIINSEKVLTPLMVSIINNNESFSLEMMKNPKVDLGKMYKGTNAWGSALNYAAIHCRYDILVYLIEKVRNGIIKAANNAFDLISTLCDNVLYNKNNENSCMRCIQALLKFAHLQFGNNESFNTLLTKHVIPALVTCSYADILLWICKEYKNRNILVYSPYNFLGCAFVSTYHNPRKADTKIIAMLFSYLLYLNQTQPFTYSSDTIFGNWMNYLTSASWNKLNDRECFLVLSAFILLLEDITEDAVMHSCRNVFSRWMYYTFFKHKRERNRMSINVIFYSGVSFRLGYICDKPEMFNFNHINLFDMMLVRLEIIEIQERMLELIKIFA